MVSRDHDKLLAEKLEVRRELADLSLRGDARIQWVEELPHTPTINGSLGSDEDVQPLFE